jgi:hypothetical protein
VSSQLVSLDFYDWVRHAFDHDVRSPEWYFDPDAQTWDRPADLTVSHLTRLFSDPIPNLLAFTDSQINQGFWYLVGGSGSKHMFSLTDLSVSLPQRIKCVESITLLFERLFATRCSSHLSHLSPSNPSPLNLACYMWWDIIPITGAPADSSRREFDDAVLSVMKEILDLGSLACQESALHGLGHWQHDYPERVCSIIDRAVSNAEGWSTELSTYARNARRGYVN